MATNVSGPLRLVTDQPAMLVQVMVRAPRPRPHAGGMLVDFTTPATVEDGTVSFPCVPGPAVLVVMNAGAPQITVPLVVPDKPEATLEECIRAAELADEWTLTELERLAQQIAADVADAGALAENLGGINGIAQTRTALEEAAQTTTDNVQLAEQAKADAIDARDKAEAASTTATEKAGVATEQADVAAAQAGISTAQAGIATAQATAAQSSATRAAQSKASAGKSKEEAERHATTASTSATNAANSLAQVTPTAQAAISDYIASDESFASAASSAVAGQIQAQIAKIDQAAPEPRATGSAQLTEDSDRTSLAPGRYQVSSADIATALGLPVADRGTLTVDWLDGSGVRRRHLFEVGDPGKYRIFRNHYYNKNWLGWVMEADFATIKPWARGALDGTIPLDDLRAAAYEGVWAMSSGVAISLNAPFRAASTLEVLVTGTITIQRVTAAVKPVAEFSRYYYNGSWSDWASGGGAPAVEVPPQGPTPAQQAADAMVESVVEVIDPTTDYQARHAALVSDMTSRVGAPPLGNAGGLALVFDHGTTAFRDWVWPELKKRGLPATLALCPEVHLDGKGDSRHQATNAEIQQMVSEGLVIASHSGDHLGAKTWTDVWRQIVVSKQTLEAKFGTRVDAWVQPGYSLSDGNYKGFGTGQSASNYSDTIAGRLLQQTYPVITGYVGDDYLYPPTDLPVGVQRSLIEKKDTVALVRDYVQQAADQGLKHINFIHPYALPDTSDTYATKADYLAFLDLVVSLRDAGKLKVLTLPQLAIANP